MRVEKLWPEEKDKLRRRSCWRGRTMLDSSGIGLLVRCLTAAKQNAGAVKLLTPSKFAVQTLKMTGLLNLFEVFDDLDRAVASFG
jgi:anti-anti-sigma regulatory factor